MRKVKVPAKNLLLLAPHCLQDPDCARNIIQGADKCARCGKCDVAGLLKLSDEFKVRCFIVGGGRQAVNLVRDPEIKSVVAVACRKELVDGIRASFPKPVLAIMNEQPHGPCKDTEVDLTLVRKALIEMLES